MKKPTVRAFLTNWINNAKTNKQHSSATTKGDSLAYDQANSSAQYWNTVPKFNSFISNPKPDVSLLSKRSDIFFGTLALTISGSFHLPVALATCRYGSKPTCGISQPFFKR